MGEFLEMSEDEIDAKHNSGQEDEVVIHSREHARLKTQGLIRQHGGQATKEQVDTEQENETRDNEELNNGAEERIARHTIPPKQERAKPEVDQAQDFGAIERSAP